MDSITCRPRLFVRVVLATLCFAAAPLGWAASAQEEASAHWRGLALVDSDAALELIARSHPGASPELGDQTFEKLLNTARQHVAERVPKVVDYAGYHAVIAGLGVDFKDGHIWARPTMNPMFVEWTGMVLSRRDHQWIAAFQYPIPGKPDVVGARLISCDGIDAEVWARQRIALFHGNAEVEADLIDAASWLLLDEGNPFLKKPDTCVFQRSGEPPQSMTFHWGGGSQDIIADAMAKAGSDSDVGLAIAPLTDGYWISLGTLHEEAAALVAKVKQQQAALRKARFVVVDLRGNGGGNSTYARGLAEILAGQKRVAATDVPENCGGDFWKVSKGNLEARVARRPRVEASSQQAELAKYDETTKAMSDALDAGKSFTPTLPPCASHSKETKPKPLPVLPPTLMHGHLVIVTDHSCFSSCLLAVDLFKKLGALQVGEATNVSRRYMEVRQILLPSRLTYFSTLQKVALGEGDFGPYVPDQSFPGKMDDTAALQSWVKGLVDSLGSAP